MNTFRWSADTCSAAGDDDRALDQSRVAGHGNDDLFVTEFAGIQSELPIFGFACAQQLPRRDAQHRDDPAQLDCIWRRFQIEDDLWLNAALGQQLESAPGF